MALRDSLSPATARRIVLRDVHPVISRLFSNGLPQVSKGTRNITPGTAAVGTDFDDLESDSSFTTPAAPEALVKAFNPLKTAKRRTNQLPPSRYQYRAPRYDRGPLHPHQAPPTSDPASRTFVPGPFLTPRLLQTYHSTFASDLMTLTYAHSPPGTVKHVKADRLRTWDDSSPYHKNRPKRGPRGGGELRLLEKDITFHNIPRLEAVTVHSFLKEAIDNPDRLYVATMLLQAVTGVKPTLHEAKSDVQAWKIRKGMKVALTSEICGDDAWLFVDKIINLVLPKIKNWRGVPGTSGDRSGNISFGFTPNQVNLFPEVEVNYDMYPPQMIPGFHVTLKTTAENNKRGRLLLGALGFPFHGEFDTY